MNFVTFSFSIVRTPNIITPSSLHHNPLQQTNKGKSRLLYICDLPKTLEITQSKRKSLNDDENDFQRYCIFIMEKHWRNKGKTILDASSHLYKSVCPSVGRSVGLYVMLSKMEDFMLFLCLFNAIRTHRWPAGPCLKK